eukprot:3936850-Rhodomonas_salina.1
MQGLERSKKRSRSLSRELGLVKRRDHLGMSESRTSVKTPPLRNRGPADRASLAALAVNIRMYVIRALGWHMTWDNGRLNE